MISTSNSSLVSGVVLSFLAWLVGTTVCRARTCRRCSNDTRCWKVTLRRNSLLDYSGKDQPPFERSVMTGRGITARSVEEEQGSEKARHNPSYIGRLSAGPCVVEVNGDEQVKGNDA